MRPDAVDAAPAVAGGRDRPAVRPVHLRHDRAAEGHRARQRWPRGRAALVDGERLRHRPGRRVVGPPATSAGSSATPTSSTRRCSPARPPCSTRASRSARPTRAPSGGSSSEHGVNALFTAPTAFRAIKKRGPDGRAARPATTSRSLRTLFLAGERLDPDTYAWAAELLGVPVIDNWWQTETGWPIAANLRGLEPMPVKPGSPSVPVPGYDVRVLGAHGEPVPPGDGGRDLPPAAAAARAPCRRCGRTTTGTSPATCRPSPATTSPATAATVDEDGYVYVMGRTDDVINVAGHRLSTGSMEAVARRRIRPSPSAR